MSEQVVQLDDDALSPHGAGPRRPAPTHPPLLLRAYRGFARYPGPTVARWLLNRRLAKGKEHPTRVVERYGDATLPRPDGPLVWLHAASVGEALSALPLIHAFRTRRPDVALLLTTVTATSAALMAKRLPPGVIHQFAPVDTVRAVRRFLDHWRPDLFCALESEIWPTLLTETSRREIPAALVSARISKKTARLWGRAPRAIAWLLDRFDALLAQSATGAERLAALGADPARLSAPGALKDAAEPLPFDKTERARLQEALAGRRRWLAASTHPGEETAAFEAHRRLADRVPGWLTLLAPRHPERADAVAAEADALGLRVTRRSEQPTPGPETDIFLIDRLGELGLWYRLTPIAFVGGSLDPAIGGHNLREAARLGPALLHGPHVASFAADLERLRAADASRTVAEGQTLADALDALVGAEGGARPDAKQMAERGRAALSGGAEALERIWAALAPLTPPPAAPARTDPA